VSTPMGESTILQTVTILEKSTDTELQVIRADTAVRTARAELWRYMPASRFQKTIN
jgi:cobalt-zinc-cadmium efflux system outer membrane protein